MRSNDVPKRQKNNRKFSVTYAIRQKKFRNSKSNGPKNGRQKDANFPNMHWNVQ